MSKAILVLDEMPENCHKCPVDCAAYMASDQVTFKERLEGCPLRLMPEKMKFYPRHKRTDANNEDYIFGWNRCIEVIEGEKSEVTMTDTEKLISDLKHHSEAFKKGVVFTDVTAMSTADVLDRAAECIEKGYVEDE